MHLRPFPFGKALIGIATKRQGGVQRITIFEWSGNAR